MKKEILEALAKAGRQVTELALNAVENDPRLTKVLGGDEITL